MDSRAARLEVVAGNAAGMSILVDDELVIGRHAEGAGRLADDDEISRSHARVALDDSGYCAIEDLGSTNGTFVNGLRVSAPQTLSKGDTIELGATTLVVRELPSAPAADTPSAPQAQATVAPGAGPVVPEAAAEQQPEPEEEPASEQAAEESPAAIEAAEGVTLPTQPIVALRLEIDMQARELRLSREDGSETVRLALPDEAHD